MTEIRDVLSTGIEKSPSVEQIICEYIRQSLAPERDLYASIEDHQFEALTYIGRGDVTTYHNPYYNGDGTNERGYYWEVNPHTLNPIIPKPTDEQRIQVEQLLKRKEVFRKEAIVKFAMFMREYNLR